MRGKALCLAVLGGSVGVVAIAWVYVSEGAKQAAQDNAKRAHIEAIQAANGGKDDEMCMDGKGNLVRRPTGGGFFVNQCLPGPRTPGLMLPAKVQP